MHSQRRRWHFWGIAKKAFLADFGEESIYYPPLGFCFVKTGGSNLRHLIMGVV